MFADENAPRTLHDVGSNHELFARLPKAPHVNLDRLGEPGDKEVPFAGQAISPAPRGELRVEARLHQSDDILIFGICVQLKVTAKIGPVIEGFDHGYVVPMCSE